MSDVYPRQRRPDASGAQRVHRASRAASAQCERALAIGDTVNVPHALHAKSPASGSGRPQTSMMQCYHSTKEPTDSRPSRTLLHFNRWQKTKAEAFGDVTSDSLLIILCMTATG
jgi:hypothetical protein